MAKRLNIAMFAVHSCPFGKLGTRDTGGMNVYVRELSRHLGKLGHRVDVFTRAHNPNDPRVGSPFENVRLIHIPAGPLEELDKLEQWGHMPEFIRNLESFTQNDGMCYDLVHSHYWLSGSVGSYFANEWGVQHIAMFHTLGAVKNRLLVGEAESEIRLEVEKKLAGGSQRIICATESEKSILVSLYAAQLGTIEVIPCGVNTGLFQQVDRDVARETLGFGVGKIILFVGRIEAIKGLENLVLALAQLKTLVNARLLIIGGDEHSRTEVGRLKNIAKEHGILESVEFLGSIIQNRLPLYYNAADVSVVASYSESFGMVILESLACGTSVVSTPVGVAPSVIVNGMNGWLVKDNSPQHLAEGLAAALATGGLDSQAIRRTVLSYDWEMIARQVEDSYLSLLKSKN